MHFSPIHSPPFWKHVHIISTYFAVPRTSIHSLSVSQLITREPVCYFDTTHPSNHSLLNCCIVLFLHRPSFAAIADATSHRTIL